MMFLKNTGPVTRIFQQHLMPGAVISITKEQAEEALQYVDKGMFSLHD